MAESQVPAVGRPLHEYTVCQELQRGTVVITERLYKVFLFRDANVAKYFSIIVTFRSRRRSAPVSLLQIASTMARGLGSWNGFTPICKNSTEMLQHTPNGFVCEDLI